MVQREAQNAGVTIIQLPGYSPDLNPIEGFWKWMREDVSQHHYYASTAELFSACKAFIERMNLHPEQTIARLWPKFDLDPAFEKLLISN